jgi:outer membrane protein assembly factor BamA
MYSEKRLTGEMKLNFRNAANDSNFFMNYFYLHNIKNAGNFLKSKGSFIICFIICICFNNHAFGQIGGGSGGGLKSQTAPDVNRPKEYELAGITTTGAKYLDQDLLIAVTNLTIGEKIHLPNDEHIARAIKALWKQELFSNVSITITKFIDDKVFINIAVEERPRLSRFNFRNIKPSEAK